MKKRRKVNPLQIAFIIMVIAIILGWIVDGVISGRPAF